jgi:hypothetical protein
MKKSLWLLGPTVAWEHDVTKALLGAGFTVVGLSPRIQQSDFDHPNFIAPPAALTNLDAAKKAVDSVIARCGKVDVLAHLVGGFRRRTDCCGNG